MADSAAVSVESHRATIVLDLVGRLMAEADVPTRRVLLLAQLRAKLAGTGPVLLLSSDGSRLRPIDMVDALPEAHGIAIELEGPLGVRLRSGIEVHVADLRAEPVRKLGGQTIWPLLGRDRRVVAAIVTAKEREDPYGVAWLRQATHFLGLLVDEVVTSARVRAELSGLDELRCSRTADGVARRFAQILRRVLDASRVLVSVHQAKDDQLVVRAIDAAEGDLLGAQGNGGAPMRFQRGTAGPAEAFDSGRVRWHYAPERGLTTLHAPIPNAGVVTVTWSRALKMCQADVEETLAELAEEAAHALGRSVFDATLIDSETGLLTTDAFRSVAEEHLRLAAVKGRELALVGVSLRSLPSAPADRAAFARRAAKVFRRGLGSMGELGAAFGCERLAVLVDDPTKEAVATLSRRLAADLEAFGGEPFAVDAKCYGGVDGLMERLTSRSSAVGSRR